MKKTLSIAAIVAASLLLAAGPAQAAAGQIQSREAAAASEDTFGTDFDRLYELAATQSDADISAVIHSGEPVQALMDPDTGEYLAAYTEEPVFSTQAISPRGPGCGNGDACARDTAGTYYGFYGTGQLTFSGNGIRNVKAIQSGNRNTTWWIGPTNGYNLLPNTTVSFPTTRTMVSITRS